MFVNSWRQWLTRQFTALRGDSGRRRRQRDAFPRQYRPRLEYLEDRSLLATFLVTNTDDSGLGSLREAIQDANVTVNVDGPDVIAFNIPGTGVHTITVTSPLPDITDPVVIDGYTQPGATPNTNPITAGSNAVLLIEVTETGAGGNMNGLHLAPFSDGSAVRGLVLNRFSTSIRITSNNNVVEGNFIGTDPSGTTGQGNNDQQGVGLSGADDNIIGGTSPAARNVISAINGSGVQIDVGSDGNTVAGNFIGTNAAGTSALPNVNNGVFINNGSNQNVIGGTTLAARNVIAGAVTGISCANSSGNTIQGNLIGTDVTGTAALGGFIGIESFFSTDTTIGGTAAGAGNVISGNNGPGVRVLSATGAAISGNSIHANGGLGIDLGADGVTPNDTGDGDTGANNLQNFPVLASAGTGAASTIITGTLHSTPNTAFRVEFFASDAADPSGFGEGQTFLGFTITNLTDASGDVSFTATLPVTVGASQIITATATDPGGNTSEFSQGVPATSLDVIIDESTTQDFLDSLTVIQGSLIMVGVAGRTDLLLPNLTAVQGNFIVTGNPDLTLLSAPLLVSVGGTLDVSGNPALVTLNLGSLSTAGGTVSIDGNTSATGIDLSSLTIAGGSVSIDGNTSATGIDLSSLTTAGGTVSIDGNTSATGIDLSSLTIAGGSVSIDGNTSATGIDLSSLTTAGGSVSIDGNTSATGIDLSSLTTADGNVSISDNPSLNSISLTGLTSVGGDMTVEAMSSIAAATADGSTQVTLLTAEAQMTATLATGTFSDAVAFTVTRLDPATLPPEGGQDSSGADALIDPLAAYQFDFAIATLGQEAALTFEINVAALSDADQAAFLTALAAGNATLAVKNDDPDSVYQAFAICGAGQTPQADGCVTITLLDADGNPLPDGSTDTPAIVRFEGVTGHFSTFAVVIVFASNSPPVARDDAAVLTTSVSAAIDVLASDTDPDGDDLTVTAVTQPASGHGAVMINPDGTLTYTQTVFVNGTETFSYTISDGHGGTATATVTVTVNLPARVGIDMLLDQVSGSGLSRGHKTSLNAKVGAAQRALARGNPRAAANQLAAFANEVRALKRAHILAADLADLWLLEVENILAEIPLVGIKGSRPLLAGPTSRR